MALNEEEGHLSLALILANVAQWLEHRTPKILVGDLPVLTHVIENNHRIVFMQ